MVWKHEGELQHLPWPAQSPHLNIVEPLWSVLETRVRNRFPPPTSLNQVEDVLQEEREKILLETVKTCTSLFQEGLRLYWKQKVIQHHITSNKELCTVSVMFPLFCWTLIYMCVLVLYGLQFGLETVWMCRILMDFFSEHTLIKGNCQQHKKPYKGL
jgi:hypothetical protein